MGVLDKLRRFGIVASAVLISGSLLAVPAASAASNTSQKLKSCQAKVTSKHHPKTIKYVQAVAFKTVQQSDSTLAQGQTSVTQTGSNGSRNLTYTASYKKSKLHSCKVTHNKITRQPVNQIVALGTYVAPAPPPAPAPAAAPSSSSDSTYTNVDGNTVPSPSSNPAGATAQCNDGTYSYSQNHSGTCSHHGGVATWL